MSLNCFIFHLVIIFLLSCNFKKKEKNNKLFLNISQKATVAFKNKSIERYRELTPNKKDLMMFFGEDTLKMKENSLNINNSVKLTFKDFIMYGKQEIGVNFGKLSFESFDKYKKVSDSKEFYKVYFNVHDDENDYKIGLLCVIINQQTKIMIPAWCSTNGKCEKPYEIDFPEKFK
jgi:hypothetical protein